MLVILHTFLQVMKVHGVKNYLREISVSQGIDVSDLNLVLFA